MSVLVTILNLQNIREEKRTEKEGSRPLKERSRRMKFRVNAYQMRETLIMGEILIFATVVVVFNALCNS